MAERPGPSNDGPVSLLALDGGGIRGLSELLILNEVMSRIQHDLDLPELPRPCDYFHLVGGTSTGGLIALLLGRFRMSTVEALCIYNEISGSIFCKGNRKFSFQDGTFKATTLENAVRELAGKKGTGSSMMKQQTPTMGRAFVCAMPAKNMEHPRLFRTYPVRENRSVNCEIWEAARATTAAPTFFKRAKIGEVGQVKEEFIDAGVRCNNPAEEVLEEARMVYGDKRILNCLVSIGTGHPGVIGLSRPDGFQRLLPTKLINALKEIATDCEKTSERLDARFQNTESLYFRFNVLHGLAEVSLEEWAKMDDVQSHTKAYLSKREVSVRINELVKLLRNPREEGGYTLGSARAIVPNSHPRSIPRVPIRPKPGTSPMFIGREQILIRLDEFFDVRSGPMLQRKQFLLYGMGGVGKTQLSLRFAERNAQRFKHIFWIDASSKATIDQCFKDVAATKCSDASVQSAVRWLESLAEEYLLLFDNVEDFKLASESLPGSKGNIIYTSRNWEGCLSLPEGAYYEVNEMDEEEALQLLARARRLPETADQENELAKRIVGELGHLPLAIDQAGAYMTTRSCGAHDYLRRFKKKRRELMQNMSYQRASSHDQAVYATWDVSFTALEQVRDNETDAERRQAAIAAIHIQGVFAMLHRQNIMKGIFRRAAESRLFEKHLGEPGDRAESQHRSEFSALILPVDDQGFWISELFESGIRELLKLSLVKRDDLGTAFFMHPLVHVWAQDRLVPPFQEYYQRCARGVLSASIPSDETSEDYSFRRRVLPHVANFPRTLLEADVAEGFALVFSDAGFWGEAQELLEEVTKIRKTVLGQEHPDTLSSMHSLASAWSDQGRWKEAEELNMQVWQKRKRVLGQEHPDSLNSMSSLATTYMFLGRSKEAEELNIQLLEQRKRRLGQDHPDTLESMGNLASTFSHQGRWKEAEELFTQVMERRKTVLGWDHPDMITSMGNLAVFLRSSGKDAEALEWLQHCCHLTEKVLGNNHPKAINRRLWLKGWQSE